MSNFIEKTVLSIQSTFQDMFESDEIAIKHGLMQSLDTRVRLLSILLLILLCNLSSSWQFLCLMVVYSIFVAILSKVPIKSYIFRVSSVSVIFTGIVLIPSLFNIVKPGNPLIYIGKNLYITRSGAISASIFIMRSFVSLSFIYILILSTKWVEILKAFRYFKLPKIFSATLDISFRYITLFLDVASNMYLARKSRNVGKSKGKSERRFVASSMGNLLIRSEHLSSEVYSAMISRGYKGEYKTISDFKFDIFDAIWILFNISFFAATFIVKGGRLWI
ncbi:MULTISPECIES: cobalt ECF transporter T component CbiQ [unclassified Thermoanaerobacterium]|uniref:cobalt ECF transporter T component CbiQ n=1 Tax=unclassified Thermoanaerobacterium TaxID=2622527 RepID=UPI000A159BCA|nr:MULTISPECIES: cobalt ECF transporter T component CbiQ [unclassified Thermoanaerobacterium]MDE4542755.1 cobalt ECF transporter T component CbiQ [Thermoanaerobacterium sp. R66]ORX22932.1 cobalt ECF transporter T component CbiQ [Thermoanaerobacterium sp. PSU-2]